jgi:hypothetical protein
VPVFGIFDKKRVRCPSGVWTTVVWNFGSGYPKTFRVRVEAADAGPVSGEYRERRALWIIPQEPVVGALAPEMEFHRRWINAYYAIEIKPARDVFAEVR